MLAVALLLLLFLPAAAKADTASDLSTINGDGGSIGEWYVNTYAGSSVPTACDVMCQQLGDQLGDASAQQGADSAGDETSESAADGEAGELAEAVGGDDLLGTVTALAPEVAVAAAAGYAAYKLGSALFGSPATPDPSAAPVNPYPLSPFAVELGGCTDADNANGVCFALSDGENEGLAAHVESSTDSENEGNVDALGDRLAAAGFFGEWAAPQWPDSVPQNHQCSSLPAGWADLDVNGGPDCLYPYNFTPEPSTFAPTGSGTLVDGGTEPATDTSTAGAAILNAFNTNPAAYASLIHQAAVAHASAAAEMGSASATSTVGEGVGASGSQSSSQSQTTGTATVPNPSPALLTVPVIADAQLTSSYVAELESDGFTDVATHTLTGDEVDLSKGPDAAVTVDPAAGSQVAASTAVEVQGNPDDTPTDSGSAPVGPTLPGVSVPSVPTPCSVFPFGVPCWASSQLSALTASPTAPSFALSIPQQLGGGSWTVDLGNMFGVNFGSVMDVVRPVLLAASCLAVFVLLAGMAMGGGTGGGSGASPAEGEG